MKKILLIAIIVLILTGCSTENSQEGVIATFDRYTITEKDIEEEIISRKITDLITKKLNDLNSIEEKDIREHYLNSFNVEEKDLSEEQEQFIGYHERQFNYNITRNEAFNIVLRDKILYKTAITKGYEKTSEEEALNMIKKANETSEKFIGEDKDKLIEEFSAYEDEVVKDYGYESYDEYEKSRLDKLSELITINKMEKEFINKIRSNPELTDEQKWIYPITSWENYTEHLIKDEKINIINKNYSIEYYGGIWTDEF